MENMESTENTVTIRVMKPMNSVDFHTHILPSIDDGSQSEEQSYRMLKLEKKNGADVVLATPHFYPDELTPTEFVKERQASYDRLMAYIAPKGETDLPTILQGAEVLLSLETAHLEDLRALAIEGTQYILIEMPYDNWQEWVYESIERIRVKQGLIPIIAHVERYIPMQSDTEQMYRLMSMKGVLGQLNTRSILQPSSARLCHKLIENHMVHVLGSDAHRGQHLLEVSSAYEAIKKKHGAGVIREIHKQGRLVVLNENIEKQMPIPFKRILGHFYK